MNTDSSANEPPPANIRVLWVEDMLETDLLHDILEHSGIEAFELVHKEYLDEALAEVKRKRFDVILLDLALPDSRGLETVTRMHKGSEDVPIIVLTGVNDEATGIKAVRAGAQDYIPKARLDPQMLARAIRYSIERFITKEELRKTNQELKKANETLKSLDKMKDEFVTLVSHELRTPLVSILGYAEALNECELKPDLHDRFVGIIIEESKRLSRLIEEILDLSSLAAGTMKFNFSQMNIDSVVEKTIQALQILANEKKISINYNPSALQITADTDRIEQVLINIVGNSIKFSLESGQIDISIKDDGPAVTISVQDEGPGIPSEDLGKVFDHFRQLKREDSQVKGTGLGLSIARHIVKSHRGTIWAENTGKGTAFRFTLPKNEGEKVSI